MVLKLRHSVLELATMLCVHCCWLNSVCLSNTVSDSFCSCRPAVVAVNPLRSSVADSAALVDRAARTDGLITAGSGDGAQPRQTVQQRVHTNQGGFWGDLQTVYQRDWSGRGLGDEEENNAWH